MRRHGWWKRRRPPEEPEERPVPEDDGGREDEGARKRAELEVLRAIKEEGAYWPGKSQGPPGRLR